MEILLITVDVTSGSHGTHVGSTIAAANDGNNINGLDIFSSLLGFLAVTAEHFHQML